MFSQKKRKDDRDESMRGPRPQGGPVRAFVHGGVVRAQPIAVAGPGRRGSLGEGRRGSRRAGSTGECRRTRLRLEDAGSPGSRRARAGHRRGTRGRGVDRGRREGGRRLERQPIDEDRLRSHEGRRDGELPLCHEMADRAVIRRLRRGLGGCVGPARFPGTADRMREARKLVQAWSAQDCDRVAGD